jgi:hypothetical protein
MAVADSMEDFTAVDFMEDSMVSTMMDSMAEFFLALAQDFGRDITGAITHITGDIQ